MKPGRGHFLFLISTLAIVCAGRAQAQDVCTFGLDFETDPAGQPLAPGTVIDTEFAAEGITITSFDQVNNPAMIFDSGNPTGGDPDLGTPNVDFGGPGLGMGGESGQPGQNDTALGNVLIVSEDANSADPNDKNDGGRLTFFFDRARSVTSITLVDIDLNETTGYIRAFDGDDDIITTVAIPGLGNNSVQTVDVNATGVRRLRIQYPGSAAVAEVVTCPEQPDPTGAIGDTVFDDLNDDGVQNPGEPGIPGVRLELRAGSSPALFADQVTDADGNYLFSGLPADTFTVDVDESTLAAGYTLTTGNEPAVVPLTGGDVRLDIDFGYHFDEPEGVADLEVVKEVDTSSPFLDDIVTYTITILNRGPDAATGVVVRDVLPAGLVYVSGSPSKGSFDPVTGFWEIGGLVVGAEQTLRLEMQVVVTNMIENIAQVVAADQTDPDSVPGNGVPEEDDQDNALVESRGPGSVGDVIRVECANLGTVTGLARNAASAHLYAVTEAGGLHVSNDDGLNWPVFFETDNDVPLRDVIVGPGGIVYAGSFGDGAFASFDDGTTWNPVGPTDGMVADLDVDDVTGDLYAAVSGRVLVYDGTAWTELGPGSNPFDGEQVLAVSRDESTGSLIAAAAATGVYRFDGAAWSPLDGGLPTGRINVLHMSTKYGLLAGTNSDGIYRLDGGVWNRFGAGLDNEPIESMGTTQAGELVAGARESGAYVRDTTTGEWTAVGDLPVFTVTAIIGGFRGEVIAGAPGEGIYGIYDRDEDGAYDIAYQLAGFMTHAVIHDLVAGPDGDLYAATHGYGVLYSSDGGRCWTRMNRNLENLWTFALDSDSQGVLFLGIWADSKGGVWRSVDGGRNWTYLALGDQQIISIAVDPSDDDVIYAGANLSGVGSIYRSTNGGDGWERLMTFIEPVWSVAVDPSDPDRLVVGTLGDGIHESIDGGETFTGIGKAVTGLENEYVFDLSFGPEGGPFAGDLFAGTDDGVYTLNDGAWSPVGAGSLGFRIRSLAFDGSSILAGTWGEGIIMYDEATGVWSDFGLADIPVIALAVHPVTGTLVIGTDGQGLFLSQRAGTGTSSDRTTDNADLPEQAILAPGYPNPFNPVTTIPFELATDAHVRLTIADVLGRTIETLVDGRISAGSHAVSWNAAGRATGTYLVRLETADRTSTRTVVLLK